MRALGVCYAADGTDLNGWLVRQGHALAYRRYSTTYVPEEDQAKATQARRKGDRIRPGRIVGIDQRLAQGRRGREGGGVNHNSTDIGRGIKCGKRGIQSILGGRHSDISGEAGWDPQAQQGQDWVLS